MKRPGRDQKRFRFADHNYGGLNYPDSQRRKQGDYRGGYPPSRPCPPNVDPETGEIKEGWADFLWSFSPIDFRPDRERRERIQSQTTFYHRFIPGVSASAIRYKQAGKIERILVTSILAIALTWGVVTYINTPHDRYDYPGGEQQRIEDINRDNQWQQEHPYWQLRD